MSIKQRYVKGEINRILESLDDYSGPEREMHLERILSGIGKKGKGLIQYGGLFKAPKRNLFKTSKPKAKPKSNIKSVPKNSAAIIKAEQVLRNLKTKSRELDLKIAKKIDQISRLKKGISAQKVKKGVKISEAVQVHEIPPRREIEMHKEFVQSTNDYIKSTDEALKRDKQLIKDLDDKQDYIKANRILKQSILRSKIIKTRLAKLRKLVTELDEIEKKEKKGKQGSNSKNLIKRIERTKEEELEILKEVAKEEEEMQKLNNFFSVLEGLDKAREDEIVRSSEEQEMRNYLKSLDK